MIHMGQTMSPLSKALPLLKRGDIVTHMFAPPPNSIVDDSGHILPEVLAARRRGVWFDIGNGQTGHMRWDTIGAIMKAGFWPDTFSTDWNTNSQTTGVVDLPNCMSKLFGYGMTVSEAIACATLNPSRIFPCSTIAARSTSARRPMSRCSSCAKGKFEFLDNYKGTIIRGSGGGAGRPRPAMPLDVSMATPRSESCWPHDRSIFIACAMNSTAIVR